MNGRTNSLIDWESTKARLDRAQRSIDTAFLPDMEHRGDLLRARARSLAVRGERETGTGVYTPVLIFRLANMQYGIDLRVLSNLSEWMLPSPVPGSDASLLGLIASRGTVWATFDLGHIIASGEDETREGGRILFLRNGPPNVALRVARVDGIRRMDLREVKSLPDGILNPGEVVSGLANDGILIIDAHRLISLPAFSEVFQP